jgi:hypothetical protein
VLKLDEGREGERGVVDAEGSRYEQVMPLHCGSRLTGLGAIRGDKKRVQKTIEKVGDQGLAFHRVVDDNIVSIVGR